jgi:tetratricopeptide (TPR) repeat protein
VSTAAPGALLGMCVPTYNRAADLTLLLASLERELAGRDDVVVLIADNASSDGTPELLRRAADRSPWLRVHRQAENLGAAGNMEWLIAHAPDCEYLWLFGDDDVVVEGGMRTVTDLLVAERPAWLFLPHHWIDGDRRVTGGSPAPGAIERFATGGDLYRAYHHWLTFLSASIVRADRFREAVAAIETDSQYVPLLWFFRAGLPGPCLVAADRLVHASQAISWADRAHLIQTLDFTALYDDGLHAGISAEDFGRSLDGLYRDGWGLDLWRRVPIEPLIEAVRRFPQSQGLRDHLFTIARETGRRDALPVLHDAARAVGAEAEATALVQAGEDAFAAGDLDAAVARFRAAAARMPTLVTAWNDLAVALHGLGHAGADAGEAIDAAVFVAPDDLDARLNRASIRLAAGDRAGASADAARALELDPRNAGAAELLQLAA